MGLRDIRYKAYSIQSGLRCFRAYTTRCFLDFYHMVYRAVRSAADVYHAAFKEP